MRRYQVHFERDEGLVYDEGGGFDITSTDEETAVRMFRLWYRRKVAERDREPAPTPMRVKLRLVQASRGGHH